MSEARRVGFIGLGNMGAPMAANLMRGGHDVMAYDIAAERAHRFAQTHAGRATESLAEVASHADIVITMLPTGHEVREALLQAQGGALAANLRPGTVVIDMSSASRGATSRCSMPRSPAACRARRTAASPSWSGATVPRLLRSSLCWPAWAVICSRSAASAAATP